MPIMVRSKKSKGKKIAHAILGTPENIAQNKLDMKKNIAEKIFYQTTHNVR